MENAFNKLEIALKHVFMDIYAKMDFAFQIFQLINVLLLDALKDILAKMELV